MGGIEIIFGAGAGGMGKVGVVASFPAEMVLIAAGGGDGRTAVVPIFDNF